MAQIATLTSTEDGYVGRLRTLMIDVKIVLVPAASHDAENTPDFRIHLDDRTGPEIGAGWKRTGERAGDYVSLLIDDPVFTQPIRANLFQADDDGEISSTCSGPAQHGARRGADRVRRYRCTMARRAVALAGLVLTMSAPATARPASLAAAAPTLEAVGSIEGHVAEAAQRFDLPASWIWAVMHVESAGDVRAVSRAGALGLMQIMPETWAYLRARYGLGADPFNAHDNVIAGAAFLREMYDRFGSPGFLGAYSAGPVRYQDHLATGRRLPVETQRYLAVLTPTVSGSQPGHRAIPIDDPLAWTRAPLFIHPVDRGSGGGEAPSDGLLEPSPTAPAAGSRPNAKARAGALFVPRFGPGEQP
jgi:uncharacterized protein (DUF736 family)